MIRNNLTRAYHGVLRIAHTRADLEGVKVFKEFH